MKIIWPVERQTEPPIIFINPTLGRSPDNPFSIQTFSEQNLRFFTWVHPLWRQWELRSLLRSMTLWIPGKLLEKKRKKRIAIETAHNIMYKTSRSPCQQWFSYVLRKNAHNFFSLARVGGSAFRNFSTRQTSMGHCPEIGQKKLLV